MFGIVILAVAAFIVLYALACALFKGKNTHPNTTEKRNIQWHNNSQADDTDDEMTEEEMIAEDYYYYQDKD